jgi:SAM-dependent methyltransferase
MSARGGERRCLSQANSRQNLESKSSGASFLIQHRAFRLWPGQYGAKRCRSQTGASEGDVLIHPMPICYTDPQADVPPGVDFLDAEQVRAWVSACETDKPWRDPVRRRFADQVRALPPGANVLELGSGPGYLAQSVLESCPNLESYTLLDFSEHMLALSRERLARFEAARFVKADFKSADWRQDCSPPYAAVLAMQAVHEVRHKRHVPGLYRQIRDLLEPHGLLAVCDGTPRDGSVLWQVSLCMTVDEQLDAFAWAGFTQMKVEEEIGAMIFVTGRA